MLFSGGKQYLIPGNAGKVEPIRGGGGGLTVNQVFNNPVMADRRSDSQRALQAGRELRLATRNS